MTQSILLATKGGVNLDWLDQYPGKIQALTVEQVNVAIHKHVDQKKLVMVKAGTFAEQ